ncbi:MAG: HU family DNA-binding protein [Gemmatimonadetes bacterium]|nr:HU family DNA-binding protein [Gemmatimonadota bacterium]
MRPSWRSPERIPLRHRKARTGRKPKTGEPVEVPPREVPVFEPSRHLRSRVAGSLRAL